jgi:predicted ATP-grasp superfamily ATP-dependent carboligase
MERAIIAQKLVQGHPANCAVFAWRGKVRALIAVEVLGSEQDTGPASIVHLIDNAEMRFAAERIAGRLEVSGFFGLDFIIEEGTGLAHLIEMNPRLTPPCYLRFEKGRDLVGALWASLTDQPLPENVPITRSELIAYTPRALASASIPKDCFYARPDGEPELARELESPYPDRTLLYRIFQRLDRKPANAAGA